MIRTGFYDCGRMIGDKPMKTLKSLLEEDKKLFEYVDTDKALRCKTVCDWFSYVTYSPQLLLCDRLSCILTFLLYTVKL